MVAHYGMSESLGPVALPITNQARFLAGAVVRLLLAHEVVEGDEVRGLLAAESAAPPALRASA
jgi:hypothetical protein